MLRKLFPVALCLSLPLWLGCQQSTGTSANGNHADAHDDHDHDHEHGDVPETFAAAVEKLVHMRNQIRDGFAKDDVDSAHEPLHEVGHLLEHLAELAGKHTPAIDAAAVKKDADELFELFGKVDEKLHGDEGAAYSDVAEKIDAAVERLHKLLDGAPVAEATAN